MTDQWMDRLSEYLDGDLGPDEQRQLELHLESCASCRTVLQELRAVVARAEGLPDREPGADLWPAVSAAMAERKVVSLEARKQRSRRFSFSLPQLVAAAAALAIVTAGGMWLAIRGPNSRLAESTGNVTGPASVTRVRFDPKGRADSAITQLQRILTEESGRLDSSTVRILAENLALIDRAIDQARTALESDPGNPYLNEHLARTMRKKIEVLRRAADLAAAS
jgi:anti-sigma factor RsiW